MKFLISRVFVYVICVVCGVWYHYCGNRVCEASVPFCCRYHSFCFLSSVRARNHDDRSKVTGQQSSRGVYGTHHHRHHRRYHQYGDVTPSIGVVVAVVAFRRRRRWRIPLAAPDHHRVRVVPRLPVATCSAGITAPRCDDHYTSTSSISSSSGNIPTTNARNSTTARPCPQPVPTEIQGSEKEDTRHGSGTCPCCCPTGTYHSDYPNYFLLLLLWLRLLLLYYYYLLTTTYYYHHHYYTPTSRSNYQSVARPTRSSFSSWHARKNLSSASSLNGGNLGSATDVLTHGSHLPTLTLSHLTRLLYDRLEKLQSDEEGGVTNFTGGNTSGIGGGIGGDEDISMDEGGGMESEVRERRSGGVGLGLG